MDDPGSKTKTESKPFRWKRLFITLALGALPTIILFLFDLWWWGSIFLLATLFLACFSLPSKLYVIGLTTYAAFALAWLLGSYIEGQLIADWDISRMLGLAVAAAVGALLGIASVALFWLAIVFVSTKWVLAVSESFDIPWRQAFRFVGTRAFDTAQAYVIVENGKVAAEHKKGIFSRLRGPGVLVVRPGNAVALERGGKVTRIVGPGTYQLERFEYIKKPFSAGIVDLRTQFASETASDVLTRDGIPLKIKAVAVYQIEPKHVTDQRPSSRAARGEATTKLLGDPEYPVYAATIRKAVYSTSANGWQSLFPEGPLSTLRDVVAAYTLEQLFPPDRLDEPDPDQRALKAIEDQVKKRFDPSWAGVWFTGFDIVEVSLPREVEQRVLKKWTSRVEHELKVAEAEAERDAMIRLGQGRASSLAGWERARLEGRRQLVEKILGLEITDPDNVQQVRLLSACIDLYRDLAGQVGQDETIAMRYIEAMQAFVTSPGPKSFVITPPTPSPGALPGAPQPTLPQTRLMNGGRKGTEEEEQEEEEAGEDE